MLQDALKQGVLAVLVGAVAVGLALGSASWVGAELPGYDNTDQWGAIYLHHHHHAALAELSWPGHDSHQMVPVGLDLAVLHGGNTLEFWLSAALARVLPWPVWFTAAHVAWLVVLVVAFQPLGRALWPERRGPALAAGLAWALLPFHLGEISAGRLTQVALVGLPLAVVGLMRVAEGRRETVWAGAVGLALTALGYWFYGLFIAILSPVFVLWGWRRGQALPGLLTALLRMGGLAFLMVLPWLLVPLWPRLTGAWVPDPGGGPGASPLFDMALKLEGQVPRSARGWLPWGLVAGALFTLWAGKRRLLWVALSGLAVLFAFGPATHALGYDWQLPYRLLWGTVPFLSRLTHPVRWLGVAGLPLVVLAFDGLARRAPWAVWLVAGSVALHSAWLGWLPLPHHAERVPAVWDRLGEVSQTGGVVVVPIGHAAEVVRQQHRFDRPLLGGMVEGLVWARPPAWTAFIEDNGLLSQLAVVHRGRLREIDVRQGDLDEVRAAGFRTVVLDLDLVDRAPGGRSAVARSVLTAALGRPLYDDGRALIWHLPTSGAPGRATPVDDVWGVP